MGVGSLPLKGKREYKTVDLKNGSSKDMSVDGSSVNVIFKYDIPSSERWHLENINIFILDAGTMSHNVFGSMGTALTNGVRVVIKVDGNDYVLKDIVDNVDILKAFPNSIQTGTNANAFLNNNDYFLGHRDFKGQLVLEGDDADLIKIVVRDDLTTIDRFEATATMWRLL